MPTIGPSRSSRNSSSPTRVSIVAGLAFRNLRYARAADDTGYALGAATKGNLGLARVREAQATLDAMRASLAPTLDLQADRVFDTAGGTIQRLCAASPGIQSMRLR